MGLQDFTMGYDPASAKLVPQVIHVLEGYAANVRGMAGAEPVKSQFLEAHHLSPQAVVALRTEIVDILAELVKEVGGGEEQR